MNKKDLDEMMRKACGCMLREVEKVVAEYGNPYEEDLAYYREYMGIDREAVQQALGGGSVRIGQVVDLQGQKPLFYAVGDSLNGPVEMVTLLAVFSVLVEGSLQCWMSFTRRNVLDADDDGMDYAAPICTMGMDHVRSVYRLLTECQGTEVF